MHDQNRDMNSEFGFTTGIETRLEQSIDNLGKPNTRLASNIGQTHLSNSHDHPVGVSSA
jgi:hypothetical protein